MVHMKDTARKSPPRGRSRIANPRHLVDSILNMRIAALALALGFLSACTKDNPAFCNSDAECMDSRRPFCDLDGQYPESSYTAHACSVVPDGCPLERCGCTPGASLACAGDQATLCGEDGHSTTTETCRLGCSASEPRCATFTPSNDLEAALSDAASQPDVVLPPGTHIDTTLGLVQDGTGATVAVKSVLVSQNGGASMIRVLEGRSFVMDDVAVSGEHALAFVAPKSIVVRGRIDAAAKNVVGGPGSQENPAVCSGGDTKLEPVGCTTNCYSLGAGGAGNGTAGGAGGGYSAYGSAAGALIPTFVPLVGGCRGGRLFQSNGTTLINNGGAGGGALQFVSLESIQLTTMGVISVGGGGGLSFTGGGSGGTVVLEAPIVAINGAGTGLFANGGAGAGCFMNGADALLSNLAAQGPRCSPRSAGDGGTIGYPVTSGEICSGACSLQSTGGGGGAVGKVRIATKDGTFETTGGAFISAVVTASMLVAR